MRIKNIFHSLIITSLLAIISPLICLGQTDLQTNFLNISMSPENPIPEQNVTISLESSSYDLNRSQITWLVNGIEKKTEIGLKNFSLPAGKNGQKTTIKVVVNTLEDGIKEIEAFFIPSVVDIIYESLSYTPPFYKGRALNPNQGVVVVNAIPELIRNTGEKIPPQSIIFNWKRNDMVEQDSSGLGKDTFVFAGSIPVRDTLIEVTASSLEGDITASNQVNITNVPSKIVFYENNPVYGIMFNRAITNPIQMLSDEFSVLAIPYFMSVGFALSPDLTYDWTLNGASTPNQDPANSFTTRTDTPGSGTANIGLKISNNSRIFQFVNNNYTINFSKQ